MAKVRIDNAGVAALLKSTEVAAVMDDTADRVAAAALSHPSIASHDMPVEATSGVSDRVRAIVTIMHPGGLAVQAKHGVLTKAVAAVGLSSSKVRSH